MIAELVQLCQGDYMCNLGLTLVWELNVHLMHQQT